MGPNTQELMFYIIVIILMIYPLFELFRKKLKWYVRWPLVAAILLFFWLSLSVKHIEDSEKATALLKIDSLGDKLNKTSVQLEKNNAFLKYLKDSSGIVQGVDGKPVQINQSTNIKMRDNNGDFVLGDKTVDGVKK